MALINILKLKNMCFCRFELHDGSAVLAEMCRQCRDMVDTISQKRIESELNEPKTKPKKRKRK